MASRVAKAALAIFLTVFTVSPCAGKITESKVEHDDRAIVLIARPFGFKPDGEWAPNTTQTTEEEAFFSAYIEGSSPSISASTYSFLATCCVLLLLEPAAFSEA